MMKMNFSSHFYIILIFQIFIAPPTESQRVLIVENLMSDLKLNLSDSCLKTLSHSIACMTPGYVGADLKLIFQKINILDMNSIVCCLFYISYFLNQLSTFII